MANLSLVTICSAGILHEFHGVGDACVNEVERILVPFDPHLQVSSMPEGWTICSFTRLP
jgi:hypothetical protein